MVWMATYRKVPPVTGELYHVFNRGLDKRTTFGNQAEFIRFYQTLKFYRFSNPPLNLSKFLEINQSKREDYLETSWGEKLVSIKCYCLMPNHFHLLLEQLVDGGISRYLSQVLNSYTRYFNTKTKRVGQLFLDQFKNVLVENEEQLLHLSRYIHLNPYSSNVVSNLRGLEKYEWSSLLEYIGGGEESVCDKDPVLASFKTRGSYRKFVFDRADYQRELKKIEHLLAE